MAEVIGNLEFQAYFRAYLEQEKISISELARRLGRNRETVKAWVHRGVKSEEVRKRIVEEYPTIFSGEGTLPEIVAMPVARRGTPRSEEVELLHSFLVLLKSEQVRLPLQNLTGLLIWFIFEASAEERNQFRDTLGDDWKHFLELTRAMTGETALEVTLSEGRLDWCKKKA